MCQFSEKYYINRELKPDSLPQWAKIDILTSDQGILHFRIGNLKLTRLKSLPFCILATASGMQILAWAQFNFHLLSKVHELHVVMYCALYSSSDKQSCMNCRTTKLFYDDFFAGPLCSYLITKLTHRYVAMLGVGLSALSFIGMAYAPSLEYMFILYSTPAGKLFMYMCLPLKNNRCL